MREDFTTTKRDNVKLVWKRQIGYRENRDFIAGYLIRSQRGQGRCFLCEFSLFCFCLPQKGVQQECPVVGDTFRVLDLQTWRKHYHLTQSMVMLEATPRVSTVPCTEIKKGLSCLTHNYTPPAL